ncbi:histidine phosphatase family protein [Streptomyces sp. P9(2023)]|uniref:histidine phosphatase family protein n=1 Tax=Streptomyces sp. P9(2023) TaxID=3064394 RepID=UPI0028F45DFC|nr:histidine phosphatase family protein [Streptomyces sp. P9(2023)]MDT9687412.1 histidine phosphatase family protein [Streptomyces sp. P9(2023)]
MTVRVTLIAPSTNEALREVRFDDQSPLDPAGFTRAEAVADTLAPGVHVYSSPSPRCHETAQALGLDAETLTDLAGCDMGRWRGRTLDAVAALEGEAVALWLSDPTAAPHGGESVRELRVRVGAWLDGLWSQAGRILAVVEPDVIRAAVLHALGAPDEAFWRLDVRPLTATELSGRAQRWNALCGRPLGPQTTETPSVPR